MPTEHDEIIAAMLSANSGVDGTLLTPQEVVMRFKLIKAEIDKLRKEEKEVREREQEQVATSWLDSLAKE